MRPWKALYQLGPLSGHKAQVPCKIHSNERYNYGGRSRIEKKVKTSKEKCCETWGAGNLHRLVKTIFEERVRISLMMSSENTLTRKSIATSSEGASAEPYSTTINRVTTFDRPLCMRGIHHLRKQELGKNHSSLEVNEIFRTSDG